MKKSFFLFLLLISTFFLGFSFKTIITQNDLSKNIKVTGIGGIFFKCQNPQKVKEWYKTNLGITTNAYGATFNWRVAEDSSKKATTSWVPFANTTKYFAPSTKDFMINYRVEHLEDLLIHLKSENVNILDTLETYSYGKFIHILDLEGNKIELWEPLNN